MNVEAFYGNNSPKGLLPLKDWRGQLLVVNVGEDSQEEHKCSTSAPTKADSDNSSLDDEEDVETIPESSESGSSPIDCCRGPTRGIGVGQAVMGAALDIAQMSTIPGVAEVAGLVVVLMKLATDSSDVMGAAGDYMVKRCRAVLLLLERAATVLDEVSGNVSSGK